MICSNIVGGSIYEKSTFVMCDCSSHIMTLFIYKGYEGNLFAGADYFGYYKPKKGNKPDVWFKDIGGLVQVSEFLKKCKSNTNTETQITVSTDVGRFVVEYDKEVGYVDFNRYASTTPKKREKVVWNVCVKGCYIDELTTEIDGLVKFVEDRKKDDCCF